MGWWDILMMGKKLPVNYIMTVLGFLDMMTIMVYFLLMMNQDVKLKLLITQKYLRNIRFIL